MILISATYFNTCSPKGLKDFRSYNAVWQEQFSG